MFAYCAHFQKGVDVFASCEMYSLNSLGLPAEEREKVRCSSWDFEQRDFGETVTSKVSDVTDDYS